MNIGILKEHLPERRVSIVPKEAKVLISLKNKVLVEGNAGKSAFISDEDYKYVGCSISTKKVIIGNCELIIGINPPELKDVNHFKEGQILLGALNPFINKELVQHLISKKVTAFSMELVPRISRAQSMDILSSMATVAGYKAVLNAANHLPKFFPMFMTAAGTIKPAKVLILGAGVAGLQALATARRLGAVVEVFDVRSAVKEEVHSLGGKFVEVEGATEDSTAGGYAVEQTEEYKQKQAALIHEHAIKADVVITTAQIPGKKAPLLIKKDTVEAMKKGSVVADLAALSGGNCELTKKNETVMHKGITILGKSEYPSEMSEDASAMFSKNVMNFLKPILADGKIQLDFEDEIVKGTCLTHNGVIVNEKVKQILSL